MSSPIDVKYVHRNRPQQEVMAVLSRIMILLWGRATGKTKGATGPLSYLYATQMPGSVGAIGCDSYKHLKREILPELFKTWKEDFGMVKDRDYWVNRFPPKDLEIPEAIRPVPESDNCIFFRNGSVIKLFSFNFAALQNGDSIDWMIVEEAKLVKPGRLNEAILCIRGNDDVFGHLSFHKSIVLISDMPDYVKGMFLLDYEAQVNPDHIKLLKAIAVEISRLSIERDGGVTVRRGKEIERIIADLRERQNFIRKRAVFVSYASTLENVHALGVDVVTNFEKVLSREKFRLSVLNFKPRKMGDAFYQFSEEKHGYVAFNEQYVNSLPSDAMPDCRWDSDIDTGRPLELCMDYNAKITCMAVGQYHDSHLQLLNTLYVDGGKRIPHAIRKFDRYYKYLTHKIVNFHYDHTANATDANRSINETHRATVVGLLIELGWTVYQVKYGQTSHADRYYDWSACFEGDPDFPFGFRYNRENCRDWEFAAARTQVIIRHVVEKGVKQTSVEKDKSSEKDKAIPPIQATHMTEAVDGLFVSFKEQRVGRRASMLGVR